MKFITKAWRRYRERQRNLKLIAELERCLSILQPQLAKMRATKPPTIGYVIDRLEIEEVVIEGEAVLAFLRTRV